MSRTAVLTDAQWELIVPLLPSSDGKRGNRFRDHRQVVEAIIYRFRTGIAWRDLPCSFGPWQTAWKRHRRFSGDGTWDAIHTELLAHADAVGELDWSVSVDSTDGIEVTADMYPYTAASTGLEAAMPSWVQEGGPEAWRARLAEPAIADQVEIASLSPVARTPATRSALDARSGGRRLVRRGGRDRMVVSLPRKTTRRRSCTSSLV